MKTLDILNEIKESNVITEQQINLLKRRMNNGEEVDINFIWDGEILVTNSQKQKGLDWLINQWKTPTGKERINNPFGYREIEILKYCTEIQFKGFYDNGNRQFKNLIPLYCVHSYTDSFEYYVNHKGIQIVG